MRIAKVSERDFSGERKRWRYKFEVEKGRQSVRERLGIQGLGNTTLIIIAVC